jgi:hypothetical protein
MPPPSEFPAISHSSPGVSKSVLKVIFPASFLEKVEFTKRMAELSMPEMAPPLPAWLSSKVVCMAETIDLLNKQIPPPDWAELLEMKLVDMTILLLSDLTPPPNIAEFRTSVEATSSRVESST